MAVVLVGAPHPDDEVLGVGGTILRHLAGGDDVHVVVCTRGEAERFGAEQVKRVQAEARYVHAFLKLTGAHYLDLPAARLDTVPATDLNAALMNVQRGVEPEIVYLPHPGDVHRDHQLVFQSAMVCNRPHATHRARRILTYETVSETDWFAPPITPPFVPNVYIDISEYIERKLEACRMYESQIQPAPHQRSIEALRALSITRGHAMNLAHAEAFCLVRELSQ